MKKIIIFLIFSLLGFNICIAQEAESDTLKPVNQSIMSSDSTATEEESEEEEDEEESEEEEEANDAPFSFRYRFSADGTYNSGNVNRAIAQFGAGLDWDIRKKFKISSSPSFIYGEQSKVVNEREIFADLRTSILHEKRLYYLAFTSIEKSNLRKINVRYIGAGGIGFKLIQKDNVYLSITDVLLYEKTDFTINEKFPDRNLWRNSTRFFGEYKFDKGKMSISHILFLQPSFTEKNFRWNGNLIFKYQITKVTSIRSVIENSYESVVVPTRKNNDFRWTFGVVFEGRK